MSTQLDLFSPPPSLPEGFRYAPEIIDVSHEQALLAQIQGLPFAEFAFHGHVGKRRTVSFGWSYDFATESLHQAGALPPFLERLRTIAAAFAAVRPEMLKQVLVTEYDAGAGIGWHRDKAVFDRIVGISLLSACRFRLRRQRGTEWERRTVEATPRSAYLLSGLVRGEWEHSVPPVERMRYSITFRSLRQDARV